MHLQNRVLPNGEIVAIPERGTLTGNRGIIHGLDRKLTHCRWSHHAWICCVLDWQGRKRKVMSGRKWTELFFLDEAVAFAAGHRPCGYCRRCDYTAFKTIWQEVYGTVSSVKDIDRVLHQNRVDPVSRLKSTFHMPIRDLPNGAFFQKDGATFLIRNGGALTFSPAGYTDRMDCNDEVVKVLRPKPLVEVLRAGYKVQVHPSAR